MCPKVRHIGSYSIKPQFMCLKRFEPFIYAVFYEFGMKIYNFVF